MSDENVEIAGELIAAADRRDADAFIACLSPDVEWIESGDVLVGLQGIYRGRERVREWFAEAFLAAFDERGNVVVEEIIDAPGDGVLAGLLLTAYGKTSRAKVELRVWNVVWLREGKVVKRNVFRTREDALEAAGLLE